MNLTTAGAITRAGLALSDLGDSYHVTNVRKMIAQLDREIGDVNAEQSCSNGDLVDLSIITEIVGETLDLLQGLADTLQQIGSTHDVAEPMSALLRGYWQAQSRAYSRIPGLKEEQEKAGAGISDG